MEENNTVTEMDLRLTECGQESEYCIQQILSRNKEKKRNLEETTPKTPTGTQEENNAPWNDTNSHVFPW